MRNEIHDLPNNWIKHTIEKSDQRNTLIRKISNFCKSPFKTGKNVLMELVVVVGLLLAVSVSLAHSEFYIIEVETKIGKDSFLIKKTYWK